MGIVPEDRPDQSSPARRTAFRVAVDMDGVLADLDGALRNRRHETRDSHGVARRVVDAVKEVLTTAGAEHVALWEEIRQVDSFWESLEETEPECVARLAKVAREHQWEVIFLTRRPEVTGDTSQRQTQRWLQARGFELPSVFVVQGSRGQIAAALDLHAVVDDDLENCLDVAALSNARPILVSRTTKRPALEGLNIEVVSTIDECLNALLALE
jgi:phosphoglycolate phosphatase-like HAD superfamily hydrolase